MTGLPKEMVVMGGVVGLVVLAGFAALHARWTDLKLLLLRLGAGGRRSFDRRGHRSARQPP